MRCGRRSSRACRAHRRRSRRRSSPPASPHNADADADEGPSPAGLPSDDASASPPLAQSAQNAASACASAVSSPFCCATRTASLSAFNASAPCENRACVSPNVINAACNLALNVGVELKGVRRS
eukprot:7076-Pelagococcus_subviridis.AAC.1